MKFIGKIRAIIDIFLFEHFTLLLRMAAVYVVIRLFFVDKFILSDEIWTALSYVLIFFLIYAITVAIDHKRAESSPLFLSDFIEKRIKDDYYLSDVCTLDDKRGVFVRRMDVVDHNVEISFLLHNEPAIIKGRASAFSYVLNSMQLPSHEKTVNRLEKIVEEANYMLNKS